MSGSPDIGYVTRKDGQLVVVLDWLVIPVDTIPELHREMGRVDPAILAEADSDDS